MASLLIASLFAADAGWKYRFVREDTTTKEIKALEKENEVLQAAVAEGKNHNKT